MLSISSFIVNRSVVTEFPPMQAEVQVVSKSQI